MAGILANSVSKTMLSGDTDVDKSITGFLAGEQITLSTTPGGAGYAWGQSIPSASAPGRSKLDDAAGTAPTFTPDVAGTYVITVVVDSVTTYVLRITVRSVAVQQPNEVLRLFPIADSQVPVPTLGRAVYFSSDANALVEKRPDGTVHTLTTS